MALQDISFGKVLSHLCERFSQLESELRAGGGNLAGVLRELNKDPVYRQLPDFRPPVTDCSQLARLRTQVNQVERTVQELMEQLRRGQIDKIEQIKNAVNPYIATARNFTQSYQRHWNDKSYFIVPVYVSSPGQGVGAGMVYLRRFNPDGRGAGTDLWNIESLTQDGNLLQVNRHYFNEIANVLMGVLYFTEYQRPHADPVQLRSDHVYKLLFNCQITHGRSHGGAILASFTICYLYSILGANYSNYIAPSPGTVISAEIEPDGRVREVDHVDEKVKCALQEFGPGITVIIPRENRLPLELEEKISSGHLHYVSTAEELLEKAMFSADSSRKLDDVRRALFRRKLGEPTLELIHENLRPEVIWEEIKSRYLADSRRSAHYTTHSSCGVLSRTEQDSQHVLLQYGFEEAAFSDDSQKQELIFLALNSSHQMDAAWRPHENTRICLMTNVVFEIARRLDFERSELVCGFLSSFRTLPIRKGMTPDEIERRLQVVRDEKKLRYCGAFLRPVCDMLLNQYRDRTKRLCVISDGAVFDSEDADDPDDPIFSVKEWYTLQPTKRTDEKVVLCVAGTTLSESVLDAHFAIRRDVFRRVMLHFDNVFPLAWEPETGTLERDENGTRLNFKIKDTLHFRARIRLPEWGRLNRITTTGEIVRQGEPLSFTIKDFVVAGSCRPLQLAESGCLSNEEFEQWEHLCNSPHVRLLNTPDMGLQEMPVFPTLQQMTSGYILLQRGSNIWQFFKTGIEVDGIAIVSIEGTPYWARAGGILREIPSEMDHFRLGVDNQVLYILRV